MKLMLQLGGAAMRKMMAISVLMSGLAIMLVACGGSDGDTDNPQPDPTQVPSPTVAIVDVATWTAVPSATSRPTVTPAPTATSAVANATFPPPAETGLSELDDQVIVTILEDDLNTTLAQMYSVSDLTAVNAAPAVTCEVGSQLQIEVTLTNAFLDEMSFVTLRALLEIVDGQIRVRELQDRRAWNGPTPSDQDIWQVLDLVERSINSTVFDLLSNQPGAATLTLVNLRLFSAEPQVRARLEAIFAAFDE